MKNISIIFMALSCLSFNALSEEVYMAIVPTATKYDALISIYSKKCNKPDGNVILASGKDLVTGCWSLDGERVKVEWFDGSEANYYERRIFRLITNTDLQKR